MKWVVHPSVIGGTITVPGDKSIAHRSLMIAALAGGASRIGGLPAGEDVLSTARCLRALGAGICIQGDTAIITGGPLQTPDNDLDAGNSGTTMRLLAGLLAGQPFSATLTGDASLRRRPMRRVIDPLNHMAARICSRDGRAPLRIEGAHLHGIDYTLPVASAQVKSAVLLAALFAVGETTVHEPTPTRDHTERLLVAAGAKVDRVENSITVTPGGHLRPVHSEIPGDLSSAGFFLTAAALTGGQVTVPGVGINPTRTGFLTVLARMGVQLEITEERIDAGEPRATVTVRGNPLRPITLGAEEIPLLIDELPLVALLATAAPGRSLVRGAAELRVKESDRIAGITAGLSALGADIVELPDGFVIEGPSALHGTTVHSRGDHRLAMMLAIAGSLAHGETIIEDAACAAVSFPRFDVAYTQLGGVLDAA